MSVTKPVGLYIEIRMVIDFLGNIKLIVVTIMFITEKLPHQSRLLSMVVI